MKQLLQTKDKGRVLERICVATDHDILAIFRFWSFSAGISCCCSKNIFLQSSRTTTKSHQELLNELKAHLCHKGREKSFMQQATVHNDSSIVVCEAQILEDRHTCSISRRCSQGGGVLYFHILSLVFIHRIPPRELTSRQDAEAIRC